MQSNSKEGVAIIVVMCFIITLIALATVAGRSAASHAIIARAQVDHEKAFYTAEAGAERGAAHVANFGDIPYVFKKQMGDSTVYVGITTKATVGEGSGTSIVGIIDLGSGSSGSFVLHTKSGGVISRSSLTKNYGGYVGEASSVSVNLAGNGAQKGLVVDHASYPLSAGTTYTISSSSMSVALFNDNINNNNKAIGNWHIIIAATDANLSP